MIIICTRVYNLLINFFRIKQHPLNLGVYDNRVLCVGVFNYFLFVSTAMTIMTKLKKDITYS